MRNILRYLFRTKPQDRLPRLHRTLHHDLDYAALEEEVQLILMAGVAQDESAALELLTKYEATSAAELLPKLPKRKRDWAGKIRRLIAFWEGADLSNPLEREYQQIRKDQRWTS
jgi:hypothetical protein